MVNSSCHEGILSIQQSSSNEQSQLKSKYLLVWIRDVGLKAANRQMHGSDVDTNLQAQLTGQSCDAFCHWLRKDKHSVFSVDGVYKPSACPRVDDSLQQCIASTGLMQGVLPNKQQPRHLCLLRLYARVAGKELCFASIPSSLLGVS